MGPCRAQTITPRTFRCEERRVRVCSTSGEARVCVARVTALLAEAVGGSDEVDADRLEFPFTCGTEMGPVDVPCSGYVTGL